MVRGSTEIFSRSQNSFGMSEVESVEILIFIHASPLLYESAPYGDTFPYAYNDRLIIQYSTETINRNELQTYFLSEMPSFLSSSAFFLVIIDITIKNMEIQDIFMFYFHCRNSFFIGVP